MPTSAPPDLPSPPRDSSRDPYRGVVAFLFAAAIVGAALAVEGGRRIANNVLLDLAAAFTLAAGMVVGVLVQQVERQRPPKRTAEEPSEPAGNAVSPPDVALAEVAAPAVATPEVTAPEVTAAEGAATEGIPQEGAPPEGAPPVEEPLERPAVLEIRDYVERRLRTLGPLGVIAVVSASPVIIALVVVLRRPTWALGTSPLAAGIGVAACLIAVGLLATSARYLDNLNPAALPEAPGLARGARVMAWLLLLAAGAVGAQWAGQTTIVHLLDYLVAVIVATVCYSLFRAGIAARAGEVTAFPVDLGPLSVLGSRPNIFASVLDAAERQLGIDLRSTWALTVVRRMLEPLAIALLFLGWLSTSVTVVGVEEQGLVERLGVPVSGDPLMPGLRVHWPWPVDRVFRIPVRRVHAIEVGHEGKEAPGPENVLWAVEHAPNEFTLLLGNGRDLITVDAGVQYRITNPRAWRYNCQNPEIALAALSYRAVMRNTVNRTLAEALSENVATLTDHMRAAVQRDADSLGLGVTVLGFTVGGMHPPVAVASSYQAVVGAEIRKVTHVVDAQAFRNRLIPAAESDALVGLNSARESGADQLARAAGEAWSFRTLNSQYHAAPEDFRFRRRLETLEGALSGHGFTVVDARFLRDGGELWVIP